MNEQLWIIKWETIHERDLRKYKMLENKSFISSNMNCAMLFGYLKFYLFYTET